ncbi:MAG TPA: ATP-binding protein [Archangium sp.]|uniref:sensor histidine kinase n=1 Tax=Archangium sp. TaxID=1872627 RepID=UPI002E325C83|nr:ATP-binding protein [Archangium sp.]HEX5752636.1 ATP-binding protein [Archangium sp.]
MDMRQPPALSGTGVGSEAHANPVNHRLILWAVLSSLIFQVILVASAWGQWVTVGVLCALFVARAGLNILLAHWMNRTKREVLGGWLIMGTNLLISTAMSEVLHWNLLAWFNVLFQAFFLSGFRERESHAAMHRSGLAVFLAVSAGLALRTGLEPSFIAMFCVMAVLFFCIGEARCQQLAAALDASRESHQRLLRMQAQLVAQEKLSSLGMLAAGIAHEINNPMAFVTSNIRSLSKDLAAQPQLPEELREYVDDVLPATLDGIRRVNAIVADLRRFARNDPEAPVEFDLNHEVSSAIRLSQGELKHRCGVELELGELPPLVGQPRQIGQVLVNLIVNAAQSLPSQGGVVKVSTSAGPDEVLVRVRDNGAGMSQETLGRLFQPFFTTKPVGEGTGLGLAVAYGIVTGHGGRIEAESEPGRGSCFTVRLPRPVEKARATPPGTMSPGVDPGATRAPHGG